MKFELIAGRHSNRNGNFIKGQIVESNSDLESKFRLKFKRRADLETASDDPVLGKRVAARPGKPAAKAATVQRGVKITNIEPARKKATPTGDVDAPAKAVKKEHPEELGPRTEDNADPDAAKADATDENAGEAPEGKEPEATDEDAPAKPDAKLGKDVTADFPEVPSKEFAVTKDKQGNYNLVDLDTPDAAINRKPLDKQGIKDLIKKLVAD